MLDMAVEDSAMARFLGETEGKLGGAKWAPGHYTGTYLTTILAYPSAVVGNQ